MTTRGLIRPGLSILLLIGLIVTYIPSAVVRSKQPSGQEVTQTPPSRERIISGDRSMEKLSADLQKLLSAAPLSSNLLAYDLETGDPLLVTALVEPGADVQRFFTHSVRSRKVAGFEWVSGEIDLFQLRKLASVPKVLGVVSANSFQAAEAPGLDELRTSPKRFDTKQVRKYLAQGGPGKLLEQANVLKQEHLAANQRNSDSKPLDKLRSGEGLAHDLSSVHDLLGVHDVLTARAEGWNGQDVIVGVVDTGVDFAHPDLRGTQATIQNDGPYSGWPFAYDTVSGLRYALDQSNTIGPENYWDLAGLTGYVHTLPVENETCVSETCSGALRLIGNAETGISVQFTWPNTSKSHKFYYSIHPDYYLALFAYYLGFNYPEGLFLPPAIIVSDKEVAGVYDTVYVDVNFDHLLTDQNERMTRAEPAAGADLQTGTSQDGVWDLSAGMLAWISDGINQPPGVSTLYPDAIKSQPPEAGRMLVFISDQGGHGTSCASLIAGQSQITDPTGQGPSNPLYAGGSEIGGVGGPVIAAMGPGAKIAAFQNGFNFPFDAWTLAALGMDGDPATNDGVNIVSNSWGDSEVILDGWDVASRFAQQLSYVETQSVSFLVANGNGGHGYGTRTAPGGGPIIDVGASTAYGSLRGFEYVGVDQFLYGDVQPWSNRGPGTLGDPGPDIVAVGAWGAAAVPLNFGWGDGQQAYDVFGGTSMSTPVAAGGMAVIYQAFLARNGRWPTWQEARDIMLTSASGLGYDAYSQGSGNIQISRAVDMILGKSISFAPSQWQAGGFRSAKYPAFPAILHAGEQDTQSFTVNNPTQDPVTVNLEDSILQSFHEETFTFSYSTVETGENINRPIFLKDITSWVDQSQFSFVPDLVRAQVVMPFSNFDVQQDWYADSWWKISFYDWTDLNGDGNLWIDENKNGRVDKNEIEIDPGSGLYEYNRFTYGYPQSDYLEASLGQQSLSRRHDGVFLGLGCNFCGESTSLQVRVTFYRKVNWNWLALSDSTIQINQGEDADFEATLSIPQDTPPGAYEGYIALTSDRMETVVPVTVQVAASSTTFDFGGTETPGLPYDNAHMFGGFNWNWRYESGDWRLFYTDIPDGSAALGKTMVVDTLWSAPATDIDTWLFGPTQGEYAQQHPELFGSYDLGLSAGSEDEYVRNGIFKWKTNTGTAREMIAAPVQNGLNLIALHNVLNSGLQFAEQFVGKVFQITSDPGQVVFISNPDNSMPPHLSGTQQVTFTSTADIGEGIQVQAFGMNPPIELFDQTAQQDSPSEICSAKWIYKKDEGGLVIRNGGLLDITTSSTTNNPDLDLDLYLFQDNGDNKWECGKDPVKTFSSNNTADEHIKIYFPEDGRYWLVVHGQQVPDDQNLFDLRIRSISGTDLTLEKIPMGPIHANQPISFTVNYYGKYPFAIPTELEGLLLIGTPAVPGLLEVPVRAQPTIWLYPDPILWASNRWIAQTPVTFSLAAQNLGVYPETTQALIHLPEELVYEPGSASGPGDIHYNPTAHSLSWGNVVGGSEKVILTFRATAQPGIPAKQVELAGLVRAITSGREWEVKTSVWINQYGLLFPQMRR